MSAAYDKNNSLSEKQVEAHVYSASDDVANRLEEMGYKQVSKHGVADRQTDTAHGCQTLD